MDMFDFEFGMAILMGIYIYLLEVCTLLNSPCGIML